MNDQQLHRIPENDDHYEVLQISPRADPEIIEAAYRVMARRYHPDLNADPDATTQMARVNVAWETLRDSELRAAYDLQRTGLSQPRAPVRTWEPQPPQAARAYEEAVQPAEDLDPKLFVEPAIFTAGVLRRGSQRYFPLSVQTRPPGIRVTAAVSAGTGWLDVQPQVLRGLDKEQVTVGLRTRPLRPGRHRGVVEFTTSWERRQVPFDVDVLPASLRYRLASLLHIGGGDNERSSVPLVLSILLLLAIIVVLVAVAVGR